MEGGLWRRGVSEGGLLVAKVLVSETLFLGGGVLESHDGFGDYSGCSVSLVRGKPLE